MKYRLVYNIRDDTRDEEGYFGIDTYHYFYAKSDEEAKEKVLEYIRKKRRSIEEWGEIGSVYPKKLLRIAQRKTKNRKEEVVVIPLFD